MMELECKKDGLELVLNHEWRNRYDCDITGNREILISKNGQEEYL